MKADNELAKGSRGPGTDSRDGYLPVLVIGHHAGANPSHVGRWLMDQGFELDIRIPRLGGLLPETMEGHSGVLIFGGPMSATEPEDYMKQEVEWLSVPLEEEKPIFGICLGAQMLAVHLGGEVRFHPEGRVEIGYHRIQPTEEGARLMDWPSHMFHWHREGHSLPSDAMQLARSETFENQAFRYGEKHFGVQFHPETSHIMINRWTTKAAQRLALPGAKPRLQQLDDHLEHGPKVRRWLVDFLAHWTGLLEPNRTSR
jgi:GMP synthase (glutamine-hydrolysing)